MNFSQPSAIRAVNRLRVLNLVRTNGPLSRADMAKQLGLNKPSCSEIVSSLIQEGLLQEEKKADTVTGRPPTPLSLQKTGKLVVAVDMGSRNCSMVISDLEGNLLRFERFPTPPAPKPEELCFQILKTLLRIIKGSTICGTAISINGTISEDGKNLVNHQDWGWKNVPLAMAFERNLKVPAILTNNVYSMAVGQRWFDTKSPEDYLYVNWGEHVGDCLVLGPRFALGEMGHVKVSDRGLCRCGSIGCLDTVAGGWGISGQFDGQSVKQLTETKQEGFGKAMENACSMLAAVLSTTVVSTGIRNVILGGGISCNKEYVDMVRALFLTLLPLHMKEATLKTTTLADKAGMLGPVAVALDHFVFQQSLLNGLRKIEK